MKKLFWILCLLLNQSAYAYSTLAGFYVRGGLGGTTGQFEISDEFTATSPQTPTIHFIKSVNYDARGTNIAGLIGLGYTYKLDQIWVLSGEFTADFTSVNGTKSNKASITALTPQMTLDGKVTTTLTNDFALLVKPGIAIHQKTQFYALIGPRWGNFETKLKESYQIVGGPAGSFSTKNSAYQLGLTVGLGVERLMSEFFGVGLEYTYTAYGDIPTTSVELTYAGEEVTGSLSANTVLAYFSYRFY